MKTLSQATKLQTHFLYNIGGYEATLTKAEYNKYIATYPEYKDCSYCI